MADQNTICIMNLVKSAGNDKLKASGDNKHPVCKATRSNKSGNSDEVNVVFNEVPEFMLKCIEVAITNLREEQDIKFNAKLEEMELKLEDKDKLIKELRSELREQQFEMDALAQYTRSENFKILGVQYKKGENTNEIVKDIAKYAGVTLTDQDISVSHRLMSIEKMDKEITPANRDKKIPAIIVRVDKRDVKTKMLQAKKNLALNPDCPENIKGATMYEDVTPLRSRMMFAPRNRNDKK